MKTLVPLLAALVLSAAAYQDGGNEHHFRVPAVSGCPLAIQTRPDRELVWGDVNIIHTTDTHGWLLGHQKCSPPETNYNGTFGDFASFVSRMNTTAQNKGYDLLLVDTGDLRDGNGLSDGYPKGQWAGEETDKFFLRLPYDVMTIGNHELYPPPTIAYDMHASFSKKTKRYLTSNAFININGENGLIKTVPIGWQFAKFKTLKNLNVTAFGVTFNATGIVPNVSVQAAEIMVNQPWFQEAIKERPNFFLLTGHMSVGVRFNDWRAVLKPIRQLHKDTPIIILGGHTHTRNCTQFDDDNVVALESGSFMDTVGWLSFNLSTTGTNKPLDYSRRYLDPNRVTYKYHTHTQTDEDFDTTDGENITKDLWKLYGDFNLSHVWGYSPKNYTLFREFSNNSVLDLFAGEALPTVLKDVPCKGSKEHQKFSFINSGVLRYDIYAGVFDQNDQLTASSYPDKLWCIPNVTLEDARNAAKNMNGHHGFGGQAYSLVGLPEAGRQEIEEFDTIRQNCLLQMDAHADPEVQQDDLTLGYVTTDQCGTKQPGDGDDVKHHRIELLSRLPKIITGPSEVNGTLVDLVIIDHGWRDVLGNLSVGARKYHESDIDKSFTSLVTNEVLGNYAQIAWKTPPPN